MTITVRPHGFDGEGLEFDSASNAVEAVKAIQDVGPDSAKLIERHDVLRDIFSNPELTRHQKKLKALPILGNLRRQLDKQNKELRKSKEELKRLEEIDEARKALDKWLELTEFKLEKNDCSRLHKLASSIMDEQVVFLSDSERKGKDADILLHGVHSFVVQHDWASAFKNAKDYDGGEIVLPYPISAFEFRISGKNVVVIAAQDKNQLACSPFVECNEVWFCEEENGRHEKPFQLAWEEIKAISIALDAEVATDTVVRASTALNQKRVEQGRVPLYDYHVIGLKTNKLSHFNGGGTHRTPRLHFRRGHWRHYQNHKVWIKWTLVGNPDLGFVDKEYKL